MTAKANCCAASVHGLVPTCRSQSASTCMRTSRTTWSATPVRSASIAPTPTSTWARPAPAPCPACCVCSMASGLQQRFGKCRTSSPCMPSIQVPTPCAGSTGLLSKCLVEIRMSSSRSDSPVVTSPIPVPRFLPAPSIKRRRMQRPTLFSRRRSLPKRSLTARSSRLRKPWKLHWPFPPASPSRLPTCRTTLAAARHRTRPVSSRRS